ncbi:MAG: Conjugal transfer protein [Candidatus Magnetoglobus multicellularis str. Araruama]|uniref:Conjugal transfer protein n=1 Tax=Candidatus Magnetoglobus multicellularis str. Araruama TaxID=890399 RepID=A0A1V1PGJ3_9BACT|nr:MAG: Conjugal transfer protein [Candidatus Magnetoglobus multicellularis str. Araruama]
MRAFKHTIGGWLFFATIFVLCVTVLGMIYLANQSKIIPYIVEVDTSGSVRLVGKAEQVDYQPKLETIKYFLSLFVTEIRSIPADPVLLKKHFLNAYNFVTSKGRNLLNEYARQYDPFTKQKECVISVEISNVVKMSEISYQVQWIEQTFSKNGGMIEQNQYTGIFSITFSTPRDESVLQTNPLGLYIDFFNISKNLK